MMLQDKLRTTAMVAAAALAMTLGTAASFAQPGGASHGPHGHGASGDIGHVIESAKAQLNLNTSQQQQWDAVVAQTQAARQTARAGFDQIKVATQAELAKAEPDLASLAAQTDVIRGQGAATRKAVRDAWLALYATFSSEQKTVVRDAIVAKLASMEQFRAQMRERFAQ